MKHIKNIVKFEYHLKQINKGLVIFKYLPDKLCIVQSDEEWEPGKMVVSDLKEVLAPYLSLIIEGCQEAKKMLKEDK